MRLRLTRRALADLGLDVDAHRRRDARTYVDDHDVVQCFVDLRGQSPIGQETTQLPRNTKIPAYNLHCGRYRGLTWHDRSNDIVWLMGAGWHESGSTDDAYVVLKARDAADDLLPVEQDYRDTMIDPTEAFVAEVIRAGSEALDEALDNPNAEVRREIAGMIDTSVLVEVVVIEDEELRETWVAVRQPPRSSDQYALSAGWIQLVVTSVLRDARLDEIMWGDPFPRHGPLASEITAHWRPT